MIEAIKEINSVLQCIAFVIGILGAPIAIWKFFEDARRQRQMTADGLYQRYLELALEHPELSWPEEKIPKDECYPWLVAILLNALSAQIVCRPTSDMRGAIKADLHSHKKYLESETFKIEGGWSLLPPELKEIFTEAASSRRP